MIPSFDWATVKGTSDVFSVNLSGDTSKCRLHPIKPEGACAYLRKEVDKARDLCKHTKPVHMCSVEMTSDKLGHRPTYNFNCSFVDKHCDRIRIAIFNTKLGDIEWVNLQEDMTLEKMLQTLSQWEDFVFIKCTIKSKSLKWFYSEKFKTNLGREPEQLIMFDGKIGKETKEKNQKLTAKKPNINIIFVDTMSRAEFYMGMPKTTDLLKKMAKNGREVLDYKLFQSISHQTYNHLQNFFNGPYSTMPLGIFSVLPLEYFLIWNCYFLVHGGGSHKIS